MSRGINKVILVGFLGNDPDVRYSQNGNAITTISVATNESWTDKNGEKQERTEWHRVKFFGKLAEIAGEYLQKGGQVYVEGKLQTTKYEKDGQDHYATDIIAHELQMLGKKEGDNNHRQQDSRREQPRREAPRGNQPGARNQAPQSRGGYGSSPPSRNDDPFPDDDIPF